MSSLYRRTPLGATFSEALNDMIGEELLPDTFYDSSFVRYDGRVRRHMDDGRWAQEKNSSELRGRIKGSIDWYRQVDNVYTFMLRDVTASGGVWADTTGQSQLPISRLKLVAVDAKAAATAFASGAARGGGVGVGQFDGANDGLLDWAANHWTRTRRMPRGARAAEVFDGGMAGGGVAGGGVTLLPQVDGPGDDEEDDDFDDEDIVQTGPAGAEEEEEAAEAEEEALDGGALDGEGEGAGASSSGGMGGGGSHASGRRKREAVEEDWREEEGRVSQRQRLGGQDDGVAGSGWRPAGDGDFEEEDEEEEGGGGGEGEAAGRAERDDEELNSDDDDDDDDDDDEGNEASEEGGDMLVAQYDKVKRVRNQWRVSFSNGHATIAGRAYVFAKCDAEFMYI